MRYATIALTAILLQITCLFSSFVGDSHARDEVHGVVYRVSSSEIVLEMRNRDMRNFDINRETRVFIMGQPFPVTRVMKGSIARVVREKGKVTAVYVEEAPK